VSRGSDRRELIVEAEQGRIPVAILLAKLSPAEAAKLNDPTARKFAGLVVISCPSVIRYARARHLPAASDLT
jgi:hypothetical protein